MRPATLLPFWYVIRKAFQDMMKAKSVFIYTTTWDPPPPLPGSRYKDARCWRCRAWHLLTADEPVTHLWKVLQKNRTRHATLLPFLYFIRKVFQDMIKANSAIINPAVLTELIPPIVAAAVRICGRESPAAIGFLTKGHPYYITMHMKRIILPATLTPLGSRSKSVG